MAAFGSSGVIFPAFYLGCLMELFGSETPRDFSAVHKQQRRINQFILYINAVRLAVKSGCWPLPEFCTYVVFGQR